MKFLIDENVPQQLIKDLLTAGHDVLDIKFSPHHRASDRTLSKIAQKEDRIVITYDKDFLAPVPLDRPPARIIVRIPYADLNLVRKRVVAATNKYPIEKVTVTLYPTHDEVYKFSN